jgi:hypothetical protein
VADQFNILDTPPFVGPNSQASALYLAPTGAKAETFPRAATKLENVAVPTSGTLRLGAIALPSGLLVSAIGFVSGAQAMVTGTNQWFTLHNSSRVALAITADDTSTAWGANTAKALNLTTAYRTTYSGLYYLGVMVAAGTAPSLLCLSSHSAGAFFVAPALGGNSTPGQTTPPALPFTADALSSTGALHYGFVT